MRLHVALLIGLSTAGLVGCAAHDDREWMKTGTERYTREDLQRDHRECSKRGDLDDACMRQRGWVPVNPTKSEAQRPDPLGGRQRGRY
jgi:hypothetical protein